MVLTAPKVEYNEVDTQPAIKKVIVGIVNKYSTTIRSDLKGNNALVLHRGTYKITVETDARAKAGKILNIPLSAFAGTIASLPISLIKSARGWNHGGPKQHVYKSGFVNYII
jgi:hypothetical protein